MSLTSQKEEKMSNPARKESQGKKEPKSKVVKIYIAYSSKGKSGGFYHFYAMLRHMKALIMVFIRAHKTHWKLENFRWEEPRREQSLDDFDPEAENRWRRIGLFSLALCFLTWGIYGSYFAKDGVKSHLTAIEKIETSLKKKYLRESLKKNKE